MRPATVLLLHLNLAARRSRARITFGGSAPADILDTVSEVSYTVPGTTFEACCTL